MGPLTKLAWLKITCYYLGLSPLNFQYTKLKTILNNYLQLWWWCVGVWCQKSSMCILTYKGTLKLFLPAPYAGSCSLKLLSESWPHWTFPTLVGAPIRSARQPVLLTDLSTHNPLTSSHLFVKLPRTKVTSTSSDLIWSRGWHNTI